MRKEGKTKRKETRWNFGVLVAFFWFKKYARKLKFKSQVVVYDVVLLHFCLHCLFGFRERGEKEKNELNFGYNIPLCYYVRICCPSFSLYIVCLVDQKREKIGKPKLFKPLLGYAI